MKNTDFKISNTTVSIVRSGIFAPTLKATKTDRDIIFENNWGKLKILKKYNQLTQTHINILDSIFANAAEIRKFETGEIGIKFGINKVLKTLGQTGTNYEWLQRKLDDLISTVVEIETKNNVTHEGILHYARWSKTPNPNALKKNTSGLKYYKKGSCGYYYSIVFNTEFTRFFDIEINLNYLKILPEILNLKSGVLQAFVRFCISHNELNMQLSEILGNIRVLEGATDRRRRQIIKEVKDNAALLYEKFKIKIDKNNIVKYKHKNATGIYFLAPGKDKKKETI
ncbi:MAG: hypothetical protein M1276_03975 [Deltaproteobacteria bacterium]|jgi:hypothetical protein|nr:hypothetical protein [Deltaproteobacteria bacterium]